MQDLKWSWNIYYSPLCQSQAKSDFIWLNIEDLSEWNELQIKFDILVNDLNFLELILI